MVSFWLLNIACCLCNILTVKRTLAFLTVKILRHPYLSFFSWYLNLKLEPQLATKTGKCFRFNSSTSVLFTILLTDILIHSWLLHVWSDHCKPYAHGFKISLARLIHNSFSIRKNEQEEIRPIVLGKWSFLLFYKFLSSGKFNLTFSFVIYSQFWEIQILPVNLMIMSHI